MIPLDLTSGGNYYVLKNVLRYDTYLDIYILIDGGISKQRDIERLKQWNIKSKLQSAEKAFTPV